MAVLVDTSVFITLERRGRDWRSYFGVTLVDDPPKIASITASELLAGIYLGQSGERRSVRREYVEGVIRDLEVIPFDLEIARIHAALWAHLISTGQLIGRYDLIIAATALANDYAVLTENVREFSRVPGLEVHEPS